MKLTAIYKANKARRWLISGPVIDCTNKPEAYVIEKIYGIGLKPYKTLFVNVGAYNANYISTSVGNNN